MEDCMDLVKESQMSCTTGCWKECQCGRLSRKWHTNTAKKILSYRHPVVHKIEPNHAPGSGDNMTVVHISVSEIGEIRGQHEKHIAGVDEEHKAMVKKIKRSVSIGGKPCKIVNVTTSTISCILPKGVGYDLPVTVTVENVTSPINKDALFEYDGPCNHTGNPIGRTMHWW